MWAFFVGRISMSKYKGVKFDGNTGQYTSRIKHKGKSHHLGYWETEERAVEERNKFIKLWGMPHDIQIVRKRTGIWG